VTLEYSSPFRLSGFSLLGSQESTRLRFHSWWAVSGFGFAVIYVSPDHVNAWTWTKDVYRYVKRPQVTFNAPAEADSETNETVRNEGGLANYTPFKPDERTQDLTNVERAWPGAGAIQRTDGTMEAFIEIDPGNMDFAMSGDWAQLQEAGEEFANKELDSKLKLHATTRAFPVEKSPKQSRSDSAMRTLRRIRSFRELLEEYQETRPKKCVIGDPTDAVLRRR